MFLRIEKYHFYLTSIVNHIFFFCLIEQEEFLLSFISFNFNRVYSKIFILDNSFDILELTYFKIYTNIIIRLSCLHTLKKKKLIMGS